MESVWSATSSMPAFESLKKDIKTDVLIIGGGIAGVLCAYMLAQAGVDYALVEANRVCGGVTKNTTAKITSQHGLIYDKLIREFRPETAWLYYRANEDAIGRYREMCSGIDCDFEQKDNYVYSLGNRGKICRELAAMGKIGAKASFADKLPLPVTAEGAVKLENQAQFNPLKFLAAAAKDLNIYENTPVRELAPNCARTDGGKITAKKIITATHFPFLNKHGGYYIKMYQRRSYVIALENAAQVNGMYVDEAQKGMSFRNYKNLLLLGGGGHRTGKKGGSFGELEDFARRNYPGAQIKYRWAAQDCMTLDGVPYIGRYSSGASDLFVATGFNKWGMTSSMVAATLLCDMVQGKRNDYEMVFAPSRSALRPQLAANAFEAVVSLLTPTAKRCPHLGCALKWNEAERSWDCPCHGSRFTQDGRLIDNPATGDLKKREKQ